MEAAQHVSGTHSVLVVDDEPQVVWVLQFSLEAEGYDTGVSLAGVLDAARFVAGVLGRPLATKVGQAGGWDPTTGAPIARSN